MSDDKKTEAIEWSRGVHRVRLEVRSYATEHGEAATPADLAAAGYVPASQLAEATAKLEAAKHDLLDIAESARSDWTSRTEASSKAMTRVSLLLDERTVLLDKLEAAEGRVRELEAESGSTREWVPRLTARVRELERGADMAHMNILAGRTETARERLHQLLLGVATKPAPEAAKPAEPVHEVAGFVSRVSDTQCPRCGSHDRDARGDVAYGACVNDWHAEPASPPSQAAEPPAWFTKALTEAQAKDRAAEPEQARYVCGGSYGMSHSDPPCGWTGSAMPLDQRCPRCRGCVEKEPPRTDNPDVLTVELQRRVYQNAYDRAVARGKFEEAIVYGGLAEALADELQRAQNGTR